MAKILVMTNSAVSLKVLGLKAYWYTGSAFTRYLNHIDKN